MNNPTRMNISSKKTPVIQVDPEAPLRQQKSEEAENIKLQISFKKTWHPAAAARSSVALHHKIPGAARVPHILLFGPRLTNYQKRE